MMPELLKYFIPYSFNREIRYLSYSGIMIDMAKNSKWSFFKKYQKFSSFSLLRNDPRNFGLCFQLFTIIFEIFRAILKNKDNMAPKAKDNMAKSQLSL
jgi:hypothetical protein